MDFIDILCPRNKPFGILKFMTRDFYPKRSFITEKYYRPEDIKELVVKSVYLESVVDSEAARTDERKEKLKQDILTYLDEIAFEKKLPVIRWMGIIFLKISFLMKIGIFVNEPKILQLRASMGANPVLFLPTHRSYADFCLMTYLCYHYDIDFPTVAAGMDFYSMVVVGKMMRETGAFYIRRTLVGEPLYAATLKQYVKTLVSHNSAPMEFFLEGTRSRSNKSRPPKYGMLSMSLAPFFSREVTDITIVPINISYDRLVEHGLFAYELLGVPKPKESTGGLLKALNSLNDNFGNIYINPGDAFSLKEFIGNQNIQVTKEALKPIDMQNLTSEEFNIVQQLANRVISLHQKNTIVTITNLVALVLMDSVMKNVALKFEDFLIEIELMIAQLKNLGASVFEKDIRGSVKRILMVHSKMIQLDGEGRVKLVSSALMDVSDDVQKKMKGHILKASTMVYAVPIIQLQLYVNPVLHYLVPPAIIVCLTASRDRICEEHLMRDFRKIRQLLKNEFFFDESEEEFNLTSAISYCLRSGVISQEGDTFRVCKDEKLSFLLKWAIWPALTTMLMCIDVIIDVKSRNSRDIQKLVQASAESRLCHGYCLSLELVASCLTGLAGFGAVRVTTVKNQQIYTLVSDAMSDCRNLVTSILPNIESNFGKNNSAILEHRPFKSRL